MKFDDPNSAHVWTPCFLSTSFIFGPIPSTTCRLSGFSAAYIFVLAAGAGAGAGVGAAAGVLAMPNGLLGGGGGGGGGVAAAFATGAFLASLSLPSHSVSALFSSAPFALHFSNSASNSLILDFNLLTSA